MNKPLTNKVQTYVSPPSNSIFWDDQDWEEYEESLRGCNRWLDVTETQSELDSFLDQCELPFPEIEIAEHEGGFDSSGNLLTCRTDRV